MGLLLFPYFPELWHICSHSPSLNPKTRQLYFHAFELFTVLASADGNEVFAGTPGALEITTKPQNTANKKLFFTQTVSHCFLFISPFCPGV